MEFLIFSAYLVAVKCEGFTTTSTREIQLCAQPATPLMRSPLLPANCEHQDIVRGDLNDSKRGLLNIICRSEEISFQGLVERRCG